MKEDSGLIHISVVSSFQAQLRPLSAALKDTWLRAATPWEYNTLEHIGEKAVMATPIHNNPCLEPQSNLGLKIEVMAVAKIGRSRAPLLH
jgi:hypothetical protein